MGDITLLTHGFKDSSGKFHPITTYKGVRKSRDQKAKTQGVRLKHVERIFDTDVSENISRRFGRGTYSTGFFNVIDKYNEEHPQNQIDYSNSGLGGLDKTIQEFDDEEIFHDSLRKWKEWIERPENKPIKEIIDKMQVEVDDYNKLTDKKYNELDTFYRGTDMYEIESYVDDGVLGDFDSEFDFVSLTMNPPQAGVTFNQGVRVEYNADSIRNSGDAHKVNYSMDFFPVLAVDFEKHQDLGTLEPITGKQNALFVDEQEIRVDKDMEIKPEDISKITYYSDKIGLGRLIEYTENQILINDYQNTRIRDDRQWVRVHQQELVTSIKKSLGEFGSVEIRVI